MIPISHSIFTYDANLSSKYQMPEERLFWIIRLHGALCLLPRRDFAQKAKSRGGILVTRAYIKESTYSWNIQSYSQYGKNLDLLEQGPRGIGR